MLLIAAAFVNAWLWIESNPIRPITIAIWLGRPDVVRAYVTAFAAVLEVGGVWLVTSPEARIRSKRRCAVRIAARVGLTMSILVEAVVMAQWLTVFLWQFHVARGSEWALQNALELTRSMLLLSGGFALFVYARSLALRVPDDRLARWTRLVMWGVLVPYATMQGLVGRLSYSGQMEMTVIIGALLTFAGCSLFGAVAVVLMFVYLRHFTVAERAARGKEWHELS